MAGKNVLVKQFIEALPKLGREAAKTPYGDGEAAVLLRAKGPTKTVRSKLEDGMGLSNETLEPLRKAFVVGGPESLLAHTHPPGVFPGVSALDAQLWAEWQNAGKSPLGMAVVRPSNTPLYTYWLGNKAPIDETLDMLQLKDLTLRQMADVDEALKPLWREGSEFHASDDDVLRSTLGAMRMGDKGILQFGSKLPEEIMSTYKELAKRYPQAKAEGGRVRAGAKGVAGGVPLKGKPFELTVTPEDVKFGQLADAETAQRAIDLEKHPMRIARRKADEADLAQYKASIGREARVGPARGTSFEQQARDFGQRLEKGLIAAPVAGAAALTSGLWGGPVARMLIEGTKNPVAIAAMSGVGAGTEMLEDKPTALGALSNAARWGLMARLPISEALTHVPEAEAIDLRTPLRGIAKVVEKYSPEEKQLFREALVDLQKPRALPASHASNLRDSLEAMESGSPKVGYIYRDENGRPTASAVVLENKDPDIGRSWLTSLTSFSDRGKGAGEQVMRDLKAQYGGLEGVMNPEARGFYQRIGSEIDDNMGTFNYAAGGAVRGALGRIAARMSSEAEPVRRGTANIVKEKGGNWLSGSVEGALGGLKKGDARRRSDDAIWANLPDELIEKYREQSGAHQLIKEKHPKEWEAAKTAAQLPIDNFIDKQLTRYIKNEMATEGDPVRALAERGVLHFPARERVAGPIVYRDRLAAGFPEEGVAKSQLAKNWEDVSDKAIWSDKVGNIPYTEQLPDWIKKLKVEKPSAIHHTMNREIAADDLGFNHLIDELSNALNPESGLPRHLLLDPKSLDRVSLPQAVERVAKINEWRAAQKAEADAMKANNAATVLYKEYPENNPLGLRWVELKAHSMPEGWVKEGSAYADPTDPKAKWIYPEQALQDALKYEGDVMGHCVGGYCDDVIEGRSRIFSLRDAKGQPHVTIETSPQRYEGFDPHGDWDKLPEDLQNALIEEYGSGSVGWVSRIKMDPRVLAWQSENMPRPPDRIVQIKGKQNRKPNDEYLPFVQDFVRSGKWSDVGDLQNTGLTKHLTGKYVSDAEAAALAERHFGGHWGNKPDADENPFQYFNRINRYSDDMLSDADKAFIADWKAGNFASGGSVKDNLPDFSDDSIISAIYQELQHG